MDKKPNVPDFKITADMLARLGKSGTQHKYDHGYAVMVSGPSGQGGAVRLAARGALRIGAGLVSVFCTHDSVGEHAARLDAIMVKTHGGGKGFADQLAALKPSAICIGPNLGLDLQARTKLLQVLAMPMPLCLDADALTLLGRERHMIKTVSHAQVVMTPHEGELRRLIPEIFERASCRVSLARCAADTLNCCVLFKGADTVVAAPDGRCVVVRSTPFQYASWLATAGSGDVLSGFVTGLLARGFDAFDAAALGANLHLHCADAIGPGLIAEDIPDAMPGVLRRCLAV